MVRIPACVYTMQRRAKNCQESKSKQRRKDPGWDVYIYVYMRLTYIRLVRRSRRWELHSWSKIIRSPEGNPPREISLSESLPSFSRIFLTKVHLLFTQTFILSSPFFAVVRTGKLRYFRITHTIWSNFMKFQFFEFFGFRIFTFLDFEFYQISIFQILNFSKF